MRRIKINLAVFAVLATVTIAWSVTSLFSIDLLDKPYTITAEFESSPGLTPGFEVTYLGTSIGSVKSVDLAAGMSVIELKIDRGVEIPAALDAAARRKSAIGEPYVDLQPSAGTDAQDGPRLADGDHIPLARTTVPISYADLFTSVDALVETIDPDQLQILIHELAVALDGRGDELRTLVVGSQELTDDLVVNADRIDQFLVDIGAIAHLAAENRDSIESSLDALEAVAETLPQLEAPIDEVLAEVPPVVRLLHNILTDGDAGLLCTLDGLAVLEQIVTPEIVASLRGTLDNAPEISALLDEVITPAGNVDITLMLDALTQAPIYPSQKPQPGVPQVPGCPDFDVDTTVPAEADRADVGPGGDAFGADGDLAVPDAGDDVDSELAGSSDLDKPEEPLLSRVIALAVPAVLIGLLAVVGWFLFGLVRNRRNAAR